MSAARPVPDRASHDRSASSSHCAAAQPNTLLESSRDAGWTSLLLDHQQGAGRGEPFETHPTDDLTLVVGSFGRHSIEAFARGRWRSAVYQPGSAGLTAPGETARLRWETSSPQEVFRTLHLYLPWSLVASIAEAYRRAGQAEEPSFSVLAFRDEVLVAQARALLAAFRAGAPDLYAQGAAVWMVTHLLSCQSEWHHLRDDTRLAATIPDRRLSRVIEFMSCHLDRQLTLDELAREAGISVHHFGRRFRQRTGMGPAAYLTTLRMEHARLLLRTTELPVGEIAFRCGYARPSAFSTAFLRDAGATPSEWRAGGPKGERDSHGPSRASW
jgi:AraC family transcriptional regulator